jgi:hypothetical protein
VSLAEGLRLSLEYFKGAVKAEQPQVASAQEPA